MKFIVTLSLLITALPLQARGIMKAEKFRDEGATITVLYPHIRGCANGMCYGGPGSYMLRPSFPAGKICKELGLGEFIRGTKIVNVENVSMVFGNVDYYVFYRSGPPGAPMPTKKKIITSVECLKLK